MVRLAVALVCTACIVVVVQAQDSKPESSLTANPVYEKNCAKCHGKTGTGWPISGIGESDCNVR
jgi:cytochrome c